MGKEDQSRKGRLIVMPHRHVSCLVHLVFSTSGRQPTIREQMRDRLHAYLGGIARENAMVAIAVGGVADHVHLLLSLPSTVPIAKAVQLLKSGSLEVDPREFPAITRVFLAAGIWGLFGQHFPTGEDGGLYPCSGQASRTG